MDQKFREVVFAANSYSRPWPILICGGLSWGGLVKLPPPPPTTQLNNPNYSQVHNRTPINQEPQAFFWQTHRKGFRGTIHKVQTDRKYVCATIVLSLGIG